MDTTNTAEKLVRTAYEATKVQPVSQESIFGLSILAVVGLIVMWCVFWFVMLRTKEKVVDVLLNPAFFRTVTVMGVIAATSVLSLAGRMEADITGAVLSGIVGYVLGQIASPWQKKNKTKNKSKAEESPSE